MTPHNARSRIEAAVRFYLNDTATTEADRAAAMLAMVRQFYDFAKFSATGAGSRGQQFDQERTGIGRVVDSAERHHLDASVRSRLNLG